MSFVDEVLRIHERYAKEIIETYDFCPFARAARLAGAVKRQVILDHTIESARDAADALAADENTQIGLLIFPRLAMLPNEFDHFVSAVREACPSSPFAMAMFHPEAMGSPETPAKLVMYLRRSPDPTIQLVRYTALDAVRSRAPSGKFLFDFRAATFADLEKRVAAEPVSDRIARENRETIFREGLERIDAIFRDIFADRDRSYARFGK